MQTILETLVPEYHRAVHHRLQLNADKMIPPSMLELKTRSGAYTLQNVDILS